jgi:hypothetical protein
MIWPLKTWLGGLARASVARPVIMVRATSRAHGVRSERARESRAVVIDASLGVFFKGARVDASATEGMIRGDAASDKR